MEFKEVKRINKPGLQSVTYKANGPLSLDNILKILSRNQKDNNVLYFCKTSSYTESGNTKNNEFRSIEELRQVSEFPNPNIYFDACYIDKNTNRYAFSICADTGASNIYYIIDEKMVDVVEKKMQQDEMNKETEQQSIQIEGNNIVK